MTRESILKPETLGEIGSLPVPAISVASSGSVDSGTEWVIDATGCDPDLLKSQRVLVELFAAIITDLGLNVIGTPQWHQFPEPGGITGLALLSESHLACHSYPEFQLLTLNLYCCRPRDEWPWEEELRQRVGAKQVRVRCLERGVRGEELPS